MLKLDPSSSDKQGWFHTPGRAGDRTLEQQLTGLDVLLEMVRDKTVLDVGCAEGLISLELVDHGAKFVHGVEIIQGHVDTGIWLSQGSKQVQFEQGDANGFEPEGRYDIVIMLALLHKLKDPYAACLKFARAAKESVVIRLPPVDAPIIIDARSGGVPFDIGLAMEISGFTLTYKCRGPFNEWCGYWDRTRG